MSMPQAGSCVLCGGVLTTSTPYRSSPLCDPCARVQSRGVPWRIGAYLLRDPIEVGGTSAVYLAADPDGPTRVVVKRMHPHLVGDEGVTARFVETARAGARITHPRVAMVFDHGEDGSTHWLAMEYLHGLTMQRVAVTIRGAPIPAGIASRIVADAAEGLDAAREGAAPHAGLGSNEVRGKIFVHYEGVTKVVVDALGGRRPARPKGNLRDLSPEEVNGQPADGRSDAFVLGVLLHELTTGAHPFGGDGDLDSLRRLLDCRPPDPRVLAPGYSADLARIVGRCMARDPDARFRSPRELASALHAFLAGHEGGETADVARYMETTFARQKSERESRL